MAQHLAYQNVVHRRLAIHVVDLQIANTLAVPKEQLLMRRRVTILRQVVDVVLCRVVADPLCLLLRVNLLHLVVSVRRPGIVGGTGLPLNQYNRRLSTTGRIYSRPYRKI
jgi:hypothetical protein